ncbi:MAG TPA: helicase-associated domain-containing protein [Rectinemataceae bacterium]|nr:helicase-associated domain-containing protein [Rectinemataceae bacterium]
MKIVNIDTMNETWYAQWRETMLNDNSGRLQGLARNYLGQNERVASDKEKIVGGLGVMMSDPEVQRAAVAMMDRIDKLIVGTIYVAGEADKLLLQKTLAGEVSYHELEYRLANLGERLLIFSAKENAYAVNPYFAPAARTGVARADILFGPDSEGRWKGEEKEWHVSPETVQKETGSGFWEAAAVKEFQREGMTPAPLSVQDLGLVTYGLLKEYHDILLKGGQLSVRAKKRLSVLFPGDPAGVDIVESIVQALLAAKIASKDEHGMSVDFKALSELLFSRSGDFAFALVGLAAGSAGGAPSGSASRSFAPFFERRFSFSAAGLARFIRLLPNVDASDGFPEAFAEALKTFGLVEENDGRLTCVPERVSIRWRAASEDAHAAISVDGSGLIHVLPSASVRDCIALLDIGILVAASGAWEITLTRDSIRRAFASGRTVEDIERMLGSLSGMPIPQALSFDIRAWENEYNSIRLFKGYVLSADRSSAKIIEQSGALAHFPHEMLGEGVYYFGAIQASAIEKVLLDIGLPPPAMRSSAKAGLGKGRRAPAGGAATAHAGEAARGGDADNEARDTDHGAAREARHATGAGANWVANANAAASAQAAGAGANAYPAWDEPPGATLPAGNPRAVIDFAAPGEPESFADDALTPELSLAAEIAKLPVSPEFRKRLEERLKRKLVYTLPQLHAMVESEIADSKTGRVARYSEAGLSARGLDFNGKVRVIQAALKAKFSRLDLRWAREGEIQAGSIRPVSLRKTDKDYILEGEDVSSGGPISIRVGSIMQVSLHKGFLLGEE